MNTAVQLIVNDFRNRKELIFVWLGVLGIGLAAELMLEPWIPVFGGPRISAGQVAGWGWLAVAVLSGAVLVATSVREHAPAKLGQFLSVRPVRRRTLIGAKTAFLFLAVVAPVLAWDAAYLLLAGQGMRTVALGVQQTLLWSVAAVALVAGFSALWETGRQAVAALAVAGAAVVGAAYLQAHVFGTPLFGNADSGRPLTVVCGMAVAAAGFLGMAALRSVVSASFRAKLPLAALVSLAPMAFWVRGPVVEAPVRPDGLPAGLAERGELPPAAAAYQVVRSDPPGGRRRLLLTVVPDRPSGLPPKTGVLWQVAEVEYGGKTKRFRVRLALDLLGRSSLCREMTPSLLRTVSGFLGADPHWINSEFLSKEIRRDIELPAPPAWDRPTGLSAALEGVVFAWEVAADLPAEDGMVVRERNREWKVRLVQYRNYEKFGKFLVRIDATGPDLWLSRRQDDHDPVVGGRFLRNCLVIYNPGSNSAQIVGPWFGGVSSVGTWSGAARRSFVPFLVRHPKSAGAPEKPLRLLVLRLRYLGTIERTWRLPSPVRPDWVPKKTEWSEEWRQRHGRIKREEFLSWLAGQKPPAPDAPDEEVRRFVLGVVGKIRRRDWPVYTIGNQARILLARHVPRHLGVFLEAVRSVSGKDAGATSFLTEVIADGAETSQAEALAGALPDSPELLDALESRGLERFALPMLRERMHAGVRDFHEAAVLSRFGQFAPGASLMLADFRRSPSLWKYRKLRALPETGAGLKDAVREIWTERETFEWKEAWTDRPALEVALEVGFSEACAELHARLSGWKRNRRDLESAWFRLGEGRFFAEEAPDSGKFRKVSLDEFLRRRPEEFRFDPVLRFFVEVPQNNKPQSKPHK